MISSSDYTYGIQANQDRALIKDSNRYSRNRWHDREMSSWISAWIPKLLPSALIVLAGMCVNSATLFGQARISPQLPAGSQQLEKRRVLFFMPDYETVNPAAVSNRASPSVAPLSTRQKFQLFAGQVFDPATVVIAAGLAGIQQAGNLAPNYGQGGEAYAQRFGAMNASITSDSLLSLAVLPTAFHQDPRYFRKGEGPVIKRIGYAMSRAFVAQSDNGKWRFNYSEVGALAGSTALANTYDPEVNRTASQNSIRFGIGLAISAGLNVLREFRPDR